MSKQRRRVPEQHQPFDLSSWLPKLQNDGYEVEIRLGRYDDRRFRSCVSLQAWERLSRFFTQLAWKCSRQNDEVAIVDEVRRIKTGSATVWQSKVSQETYDDYRRHIRFSLAVETTISPRVQQWNRNVTNFTRVRERTSFLSPDGALRMDLTHLKVPEEQHEAELEILSPNINTGQVQSFLEALLTVYHGNFVSIPDQDEKLMMAFYQTILKTSMFCGSKVVSLSRPSMSPLSLADYVVQVKTDGERVQLLVLEQGYVVFVTTYNTIQMTDIVCDMSMAGTIMDAEVTFTYDKEVMLQKIHFDVFDVIAYRGNSLVDDKRYHLDERLAFARQVLKACRPTPRYSLHLKYGIGGNVFAAAGVLLDTTTAIDGVIFTPVHQAYKLHIDRKVDLPILKWKPVELNTIDFWAVQQADGQTWELYVIGDGGTHVLFQPSGVDLCTHLVTFDPSARDCITGSPFQTKTVIECRWDHDAKMFRPLRTRYDKIMNKSKHGNYVTIANSIWETIMHGVTLTELVTTPHSEDLRSARAAPPFPIDADRVSEGDYLVRPDASSEVQMHQIERKVAWWYSKRYGMFYLCGVGVTYPLIPIVANMSRLFKTREISAVDGWHSLFVEAYDIVITASEREAEYSRLQNLAASMGVVTSHVESVPDPVKRKVVIKDVPKPEMLSELISHLSLHDDGPSPTSDNTLLTKMTVAQLRQKCRDQNLSTHGIKRALVERLSNAVQ